MSFLNVLFKSENLKVSGNANVHRRGKRNGKQRIPSLQLYTTNFEKMLKINNKTHFDFNVLIIQVVK